jgi:hypothetical protein
MTKLRELEQRLRDEPDNLGLRVVVAGALHEAGRRADAVELYRSVAMAYRDQGRPQQAITVCRSILELAPDDAACRELLAQLVASQTAPRASPPPRPSPALRPVRPSPSPLPRPSALDVGAVDAADGAEDPARRSSGEMTPLPVPLAHHDAEPSTGLLRQLTPADLPPSLRQELSGYPEITGIAAAARQISASLIAASRVQETQELELEDLVTADRTTDSTVDRTIDHATDSTTDHTTDNTTDDDPDDDEPTFPPPDGVPRDSASDDEKTEPRDMPIRVRAPRPRAALPLAAPAEPPGPPPLASIRSIALQTTATGPLAGAFFAPLPPRNRAAVLQRFRRRIVAPGTPVIQRGETGHGLVVVVRGRLDVQVAHAAAGSPRALGAIGPGEFIGEVSLLARAPAAADVVAGADAEILVLAADDFYDVISSFPALRSELEAVAARRVRDHDRPRA